MSKRGNSNSIRVSFIAGASTRTTTSQFMACYLSSAMTANIATAAADDVIGIIDSYQSASSQAVDVIVLGPATGVMRTGTTCVIGALLIADAGGTLDVALTNTTDQTIIGRAMSVPVSGGVVRILVNPMATLTAP